MRHEQDRGGHRAGIRGATVPYLAAFAMLALGLLAEPARAACSPKALEIPVRIVNSRPIATVRLNGVEMPLLVDSGASHSMLPESTAAQLKLKLFDLPYGVRFVGYTGAIRARRARIDKVEFQGAQFSNVEFVVGGNELGSGILGVLGRNFLSSNDTEYDLAHGVVRLVLPQGDCDKVNFAYWAGKAPVIVEALDQEFGGEDSTPRVAVRINGIKFSALLDTGAARTSIKLRAAKRAGIKESELEPLGRVGGVGAGNVLSWSGNIASFELGGEKIANNQFEIHDLESGEEDMVIGLDYFLSHRIYLSQLQRRLYATWNGGPVFSRDGAGGDYDARFAAAPGAVSADDPDALARRAAAAVSRGDYAHALEDLNRACELAPKATQHLLARARVHHAMGQPERALGDVDEALRLQPTLDTALLARASLRSDRGDRGGALADLQQLDALLQPSSGLRADMASLYAGLELAPEALHQWELWMPSHRNDTRRAHVLNSRCWLRTRLGMELDKALEDCEDAVALDGGDAFARDSLGWTHLRMGDASRARKAFDAALEPGPRPWPLYGRGLAYRRLGKAADAQRDLDAARKLRPQIDDDVRKAGFTAAEDAPPPSAGSSGG